MGSQLAGEDREMGRLLCSREEPSSVLCADLLVQLCRGHHAFVKKPSSMPSVPSVEPQDEPWGK